MKLSFSEAGSIDSGLSSLTKNPCHIGLNQVAIFGKSHLVTIHHFGYISEKTLE
ncbi:hypothetical protein HDC90_001548 [Pedobacter sp. AK013]|nr:hypothetical protein [Pedobacter sp. AK013]